MGGAEPEFHVARHNRVIINVIQTDFMRFRLFPNFSLSTLLLVIGCFALLLGWATDHRLSEQTHIKQLNDVAVGSFLYSSVSDAVLAAQEYEDSTLAEIELKRTISLINSVHIVWKFEAEINCAPMNDEPAIEIAAASLRVLKCKNADEYFAIALASMDSTEFDLGVFSGADSEIHESFYAFVENAILL